jgi:hypothetical protein
VLAAHQPDLLPWTGFFHKMWQADVFDIGVWDQFSRRSTQHVVKMRGVKFKLPVQKAPVGTPACDVRLADRAGQELVESIRGWYLGSPKWSRFGEPLLDAVVDAAERTDRLAWFNLELILAVKRMLGITTPVVVSGPLIADTATKKLVELCLRNGQVSYLSGRGALKYLDVEEFERVGMAVHWTNHAPCSDESALSCLFDHGGVHVFDSGEGV